MGKILQCKVQKREEKVESRRGRERKTSKGKEAGAEKKL